MTNGRVPLSVLDLAIVSEGSGTAEALSSTTTLARHVDRLGYLRFWVAEHHNMPSVASTTPPVLIAHLAAHTERIRVGSGGVMLPNHASLVVAEQFAMLEALHPGRIDLGIGRAPGTDGATAAALRRTRDAFGTEDFPRQLVDLMGLLGDERAPEGMWERFTATPVLAGTPTVALLGSSGYSAQLAGMLGLPFVFAHHFDMGGTFEAFDLYRESFQPSATREEPYSMVTANVLVADTAAEAEAQAGPGRMMLLARHTGRFMPLMSPEAAAAHPQRELAAQVASNRVVGTVDEVVAKLDDLVAATGADELMVSTVAYEVATRCHSMELLAGAWGLEPAEVSAGAAS
ncbi:MAG: MsnO8 family LLM class oxidoreductase [Acidimicrobiia bacterium]|nr:MsnO8 family LLM class oxidoreductase [Acidimicrobiia bacterium]